MKKHLKSGSLFWAGVLISAALSGCLGMSRQSPTGLAVPEGMSIEPALQPMFSTPAPSEGSLWNNGKGSIFEDSKATRVGDTVIVDIVENSSSSMDVNTDSSRTTGMDIGVPTLNLLGRKKIIGTPVGATQLVGTDFFK